MLSESGVLASASLSKRAVSNMALQRRRDCSHTNELRGVKDVCIALCPCWGSSRICISSRETLFRVSGSLPVADESLACLTCCNESQIQICSNIGVATVCCIARQVLCAEITLIDETLGIHIHKIAAVSMSKVNPDEIQFKG